MSTAQTNKTNSHLSGGTPQQEESQELEMMAAHKTDISSFTLRTAKQRPPHPADDLSFMCRKKPAGTGCTWWNVQPTDDYGADCKRGEAIAAEYLDYLARHPTNGNAVLLGWIVGDLLERNGGRAGGLEVGFFGAVNRAAMATAVIQHRHGQIAPESEGHQSATDGTEKHELDMMTAHRADVQRFEEQQTGRRDADSIDEQIQQAVAHLSGLIRKKDPTATECRVEDRTDETGRPAFRITTTRPRCSFMGDGWYEIAESWTVEPSTWHFEKTDHFASSGERLYKMTPQAAISHCYCSRYVEQWLMEQTIFRYIPDYIDPPYTPGEVISLDELQRATR